MRRFYRPLPLAQVASSATGGAPIAPPYEMDCILCVRCFGRFVNRPYNTVFHFSIPHSALSIVHCPLSIACRGFPCKNRNLSICPLPGSKRMPQHFLAGRWRVCLPGLPGCQVLFFGQIFSARQSNHAPKNPSFVTICRKNLCKLPTPVFGIFSCGKPLWKNLWRMWKTMGYQQQNCQISPPFPHLPDLVIFHHFILKPSNKRVLCRRLFPEYFPRNLEKKLSFYPIASHPHPYCPCLSGIFL